jgi:hypothetical protein
MTEDEERAISETFGASHVVTVRLLLADARRQERDRIELELRAQAERFGTDESPAARWYRDAADHIAREGTAS